MPRRLNLANLLTLTRLFLTPFVIRAILRGQHPQALALCFVAGVTDAFDGAVARRFHQATQFGAYLDPIADKCLLSGIFLALGAVGSLPWWMVAIVFGRDIFILLAVVAIMALTNVRSFPPSRWGKISTFTQICGVIGCMLQNIFQHPVLGAASAAMLWVCMAFTIWSGLDYARTGLRTLRAH
jgi:cardiolipin synthase